MKKYAPWAVLVIVLIVVAALLIPQLTSKDEIVTPTAVPATATPVPETPEESAAPAADATAEPAADDASADATQAPESADVVTTPVPETVMATVNGQNVTYEDVDLIAQNLIYSYSQYGYDFSDAAMLDSMYQMAMEYAIQLELMDQKATEWGFDQMTDEEKAALEAEIAAEWENLIDTYTVYYIGLTDSATEEEKAAARVSAIAGLESMGYTEAVLLDSAMENAKYDKVEAEMIKGAEVTDEEIKAAFDEKVASDEAAYSADIASYEYMTNYYGETSYYQPEGYRGITHILLEVDEELLTAYQDLAAQLEEQEEAAEAAASATEAPAATDAATESAEPTAEPTATPVPVTQADVDAAYAAVMASVQPTIDEINQKLADGVSFADLIAEYGTDPGMTQEPNKSEGYPVHMDSIVWDPVFTQAAFSVDNVGDIAEPVLGSYGVHIVQYTRDVPAGPIEMTEEVTAALRESVLASKEDALFSSTMESWMAASEVSYTAEGAVYAPAQ